jgi:hypothetical protein
MSSEFYPYGLRATFGVADGQKLVKALHLTKDTPYVIIVGFLNITVTLAGLFPPTANDLLPFLTR